MPVFVCSVINVVPFVQFDSSIWFLYIHYYQVYYKLTIDHLSMWLGSSVDTAFHRYCKVMGSNLLEVWIFFRLLFQLLKLKADCEDHKFHSCLSAVPYIIFICSYSYIFTIIRYITNSQLTIYPCGLVAQWIEHCTGIARSWVWILFKPDFFFRLLFQPLKLRALRGSQISLNFCSTYKPRIRKILISRINLHTSKNMVKGSHPLLTITFATGNTEARFAVPTACSEWFARKEGTFSWGGPSFVSGYCWQVRGLKSCMLLLWFTMIETCH